MEENKEMLEEA